MEFKNSWYESFSLILLVVLLQACSSDNSGDEQNRFGVLRLSAVERDYGNDGDVNERLIYNYNSDGIVTSLDAVDVVDGSIDTKFKYTNDVDGRVVEYVVDIGNDGSEEGKTTINYDESGLELSRTSTNIFNGIPSVQTNVYDSDGRWLETSFELNGVFAATNSISQNVYDEFGRLSRELIDSDGDNVPDSATYYEYGPMNEIVKTRSDNGIDGGIDGTVDYSYELGLCDTNQFGVTWGTICL